MEDPTTARETTTNRAEAERLLGIAEKLLQNRDLGGSRDFAILAQETEPLLEGSDQILAVADVLLASENRINNNQHDWYSILQMDRKSDDIDVVKKQYRRLALLLHPDKNKFPLADSAFKLVADAWAVLSDSSRKSVYDNERSYFFTKVDLVASRSTRNQGSLNRQSQQQQHNMQMQQQQQQQVKLPVRRNAREKNKQKGGGGGGSKEVDDSGGGGGGDRFLSFWTACPYCYILYEYPKAYDECCLRCQNCQRAFHAASIPSLPPLVPGKEAYYCCWGFFPLGFSMANSDGSSGGKGVTTGGSAGGGGGGAFPNWMPPMFSHLPPQSDGKVVGVEEEVNVNVEFSNVDGNASGNFDSGSNPKKRGRPRKYPRQA